MYTNSIKIILFSSYPAGRPKNNFQRHLKVLEFLHPNTRLNSTCANPVTAILHSMSRILYKLNLLLTNSGFLISSYAFQPI